VYIRSKTKKQLAAINKSRNAELNAIRKLDPGFSCQGLVGEFIGLYIQSEVFAKKIQRYYWSDTNKSGKDNLYTRSLKAAMKHFNLEFSERDIKVMFTGGPGNKGMKSARQLRNGYLHSLSPNDANEIRAKASTLIPLLANFLSYRLNKPDQNQSK